MIRPPVIIEVDNEWIKLIRDDADRVTVMRIHIVDSKITSLTTTLAGARAMVDALGRLLK